ncbi:MAG: hypothetical protein VX624_00495 [Pseudomonadota bacterium]|nr:hypothetical protein [Pseudomonadota bacterium]
MPAESPHRVFRLIHVGHIDAGPDFIFERNAGLTHCPFRDIVDGVDLRTDIVLANNIAIRIDRRRARLQNHIATSQRSLMVSQRLPRTT